MSTRSKVFALHVLAAQLLVLPLAAQTDPDRKIRSVETGLLPAAVIEGRPAQSMTILERIKHHQTPGVSIAVISGGVIEWARGYGLASSEGQRPVTADTLFQAASISKPVTAMVALRLVELGKLSLDQDVNARLRSWKVVENDFCKTEKVTLRRLLSHTAGLTVHGFPGYAEGEPIPSLLQILDGIRPANSPPIRVEAVPGSRWSYSGGGYEIVQLLIEDVTGRPFREVARELVLDPLGMTRSTFEQPLPGGRSADAATGHRPDGRPIQGKWHTYPELAAAGLWTTPSDLARVVLEIQSPGRVLKPATVKEMLTGVIGPYGLGLGLGDTGGLKSFSHNGGNEGFRCTLFGYRDSGRGAVLMTNGDRGDALSREILSAISAQYGWSDFQPRRKTLASVPAQVLRSYAGIYQAPVGRFAGVAFEDGRLYVTLPSSVRVEILPESENAFFDPDGALPDLRFVKKPDQPMELVGGGMTARRIENKR